MKPTPIQVQTIPLLAAGKDLLGIAETGTGKTAAFALPILAASLAAATAASRPGAPHALILAPTRELASQIGRALRALTAAACPCAQPSSSAASTSITK